MSLDVYLSGDLREVPCVCGGCGHSHTVEERDVYYDDNITHNLGAMAKEAGVYFALWRPEEIGVERAGQLVPVLREGLDAMRADPERFRRFNPTNGWGKYEGLLQFVENYLAACEAHPDALVLASR